MWRQCRFAFSTADRRLDRAQLPRRARDAVSTPGHPRRPLNAKAATALDPYLRAVRHHPWLVSTVALIGVAVAITWTTQRPHHFQATAQVLVTPQSAAAATSGLPILTESVDPTRTLKTAATMLTSQQAAAVTVRRLHNGLSVAAVRSQLTVEPQGDTNVVGVTATASSRPAALELANVYTEAALRIRRDTLRRQVADALAAVQARAKSLGGSRSAAGSTLADQAGTLRTILQGPDPNFALLQAAVPTAPRGKSPTYKLVVRVLSALALAVAVALVVEQFNHAVRDEEDVTRAAPLPVLARIPVDRHRRDEPGVSPGATDALRTLQIQLETRAGEPHTILITSPSEGDGKTTIALALARNLVAAGRTVVLLDFDLRKGDLGQRLPMRRAAQPLTASDDADIAQALARVDGADNLRVLSATHLGAHEDSRRLREIVECVRPLADFILIDTPPITQVADALLLAAHVDEVLLIARLGHTDRRDLAAARLSLQQLAIVPTGLILVGAARRDTDHAFAGAPSRARGPSSAAAAGTDAAPVRQVR